MMNYETNELSHYGVKGMKWGRRKASKYSTKAKMLRSQGKNKEADKYDAKSKQAEKESRFQGEQARVGASRSLGAKLATNILAGPFANRTYNSIVAAGGTKMGARVLTGVTGVLAGPLGHVVVAHIITKDAGTDGTVKKF